MYSPEDKLKIIKYYNKYGLEAVKESLEFQEKKVSRRSIFNWKKKYREDYDNLNSLRDKSRRPKRYRSSKIDIRIVNEIQRLRKVYPLLGKDKLKIFVDQFCLENRIDPISISTIGRTVSRLKQSKSIPLSKPSKKVYLDARAGKLRVRIIRKQKKTRRKDYKPEYPGDLLQIDTVELRIQGMRRFIISAIDLKSRFTFSLAYKNLNSSNSTDFYTKLEQVFPYKIKHVQSDNGLEFHKHFQNYLKTKNITQFFNYPRSPKMNAFIERYNRTIQEEFAYANLLNLKDNLGQFNKDLIDYLIYYNFTRPHQGLDYKTPMEYLRDINLVECNMWWTRTIN
jgi:putative transposase